MLGVSVKVVCVVLGLAGTALSAPTSPKSLEALANPLGRRDYEDVSFTAYAGEDPVPAKVRGSADRELIFTLGKHDVIAQMFAKTPSFAANFTRGGSTMGNYFAGWTYTLPCDSPDPDVYLQSDASERYRLTAKGLLHQPGWPGELGDGTCFLALIGDGGDSPADEYRWYFGRSFLEESQ